MSGAGISRGIAMLVPGPHLDARISPSSPGIGTLGICLAAPLPGPPRNLNIRRFPSPGASRSLAGLGVARHDRIRGGLVAGLRGHDGDLLPGRDAALALGGPPPRAVDDRVRVEDVVDCVWPSSLFTPRFESPTEVTCRSA